MALEFLLVCENRLNVIETISYGVLYYLSGKEEELSQSYFPGLILALLLIEF
ncbi:hypothetical protein [Lutispora thermophila]|uniref:hypothetical protein n=1 Tax=Lutispora thermophila TaxID=288966 RepID=UPI0015870C7F|nr:hypothetical protein [Lutispora thermophila]